ncbi:MAG: type I glutamate--ammonia ligase, partial [Burkholderiales bacterium]
MPAQTKGTEHEPEVHIEPGRYNVQRPKSVEDVIALIKKYNIQIVDLKFTDLPGLWQHFSIT